MHDQITDDMESDTTYLRDIAALVRRAAKLAKALRDSREELFTNVRNDVALAGISERITTLAVNLDPALIPAELDYLAEAIEREAHHN